MNITEKTIQRINQGDVKAFEELYRAYYVYLGAVATKYVFQVEVAREITNDVFLNCWQRRATLSYPILPYLLRAIKNRCINYLQRRRNEECPMSDAAEQLLAFQQQQIDQDAYPLAQLEHRETRMQIRRAVETLPPRCQQFFRQYLYGNKSYEEIAQLYQVSNSTVRVQIKIAIDKLKTLLSNLSLLLLGLFS